MIIQCTKKLAKKLENVGQAKLAENNPLGSWHGNLYHIDRRQCVLFCHDQTRFVLFAAGLRKKDFLNLDYWFKDLYANTLLKVGHDTGLIENALTCLDDLRFDTVCDRSVQGSMRTVRAQELEGALMDVPDVMDLPMYSTSAYLNRRPVTTKGMKSTECLWPIDAMQALIQGLP